MTVSCLILPPYPRSQILLSTYRGSRHLRETLPRRAVFHAVPGSAFSSLTIRAERRRRVMKSMPIPASSASVAWVVRRESKISSPGSSPVYSCHHSTKRRISAS